MFSWIIYSLFRMVAQVYLYFTNVGGWKVLQNTWEKNGIIYERYRIQNEGHSRHFVFTKNNDLYLDEDLDWHRIICFSDSILACTVRPVRIRTNEEPDPVDITDVVKEFSHYIWCNPFLTLSDLLTLTKNDNDNEYTHFNLMIIFSDLSEKECIVKGEDSLQVIFKKNENPPQQNNLDEVPFM